LKRERKREGEREGGKTRFESKREEIGRKMYLATLMSRALRGSSNR
jgi:hypothetical protein